MKKLVLFSLMTMALMALMVGPIFACGGDKTTSAKADNGAKAQMVSSKGTCTGAAHMTQADMAKCNMDPAECLAKCGMSPEECKLYSDNTKYELVNMSVNGMMCTGCEHKVEAGLSGVKGVAKVAKVDYKTGTALVVMKKGECCNQSLTTAVANQGFEATVIPAVATMDTPAKMTGAKSGCAASCTGKAKATNASAKKAEDTK